MPVNWANLVTRSPATGAYRTLSPEFLADAYLAPKPDPINWDAVLSDPLAPWHASFTAAPKETQHIVVKSLRALMGATNGLSVDEVDITKMPMGRARDHLAGLCDLWQQLGNLPDDLYVIRHVLLADNWLEPVPLLDLEPRGWRSPLEKALFNKLAADHGVVDPAGYRIDVEATAGSSLRHLQTSIIDPAGKRKPLDDTIKFYGVRDLAEEADLAAGIARRFIDDGVPASDLALMLPTNSYGIIHFSRAFERAGVLLSGIPDEAMRDEASETLFLILNALRTPVPPMVIASLCLSSLMPWTASQGRKYARQFIQNGWCKDVKESIGHHFKFTPKSNKELLAKLGVISKDIPNIEEDIQIVAAHCSENLSAPPDWAAILAEFSPHAIRPESPQRYVEGVSLWFGNTEPWRATQHLIVAGFIEDNYPEPVGRNAMFLDRELQSISKNCGLYMPTGAQIQTDRLARFAGQLGFTQQSVIFTSPYRDFSGKRLGGASSLPLIVRTFDQVDDASDMVIDLHNVPSKDWPCASSAVAQCEHSAPVLPVTGKIEFPKIDLVKIRRETDGRMKPQSPSRLETMMVSPLIWVMNELGATRIEWVPETLTVLHQGSLFHSLLEHLFVKGAAIPSTEEITARIPDVFGDAVNREAAFLETDAWTIEREKMQADALNMALRWREVLTAIGAKIIGNEQKLSGVALGLRLHGYADTIVELQSGQKLVVDFKTSKSDARRKRMESGWDMQIALYRAMMVHPEGDATKMVKIDDEPAIAYHLLRDGVTLANGILGNQTIPEIDPVTVDISENAMTKLEETIAALRAGTIDLNIVTDVAFFEKQASLTPYALKDNPLANAFSLLDDGAGDE